LNNILIKILIVFWLTSLNIIAQINNNGFIFEPKADSNTTSKWNVQLNTFSYFHNREFFGKIADGYTLFGNQISPSIIYSPAKNVTLEAGIFLWKDFGNQYFSSIQPTFTVNIKKDSTQFRFGNLKGNLNHQLIDPLYNFEGIISNNLENGIQLITKKNGSFFDLWVDWQKMIYQNSPFKEEIWGGIHYRPVLYKKNNAIIRLPIQFTAYHKGGQITIDNRPLKTEINLALGFESIWNRTGFFRKIAFQNYVLGFKEQSNVIKEYKSGLGLYLNFMAEHKSLSTMISYWKGNSFYSKAGTDIYQSVNRNNQSNTEKIRNLLIFKFYRDFKIIDKLMLTARFEPYFDLNNGIFEHSEGLFITYKEIFGIKK
jgi:hypothetical protein